MTTGSDLVAAAKSFTGQPYSTGPARTDPNSSYKDCSGLVVASLAKLGVHLPAQFAPVSTGLELWCRSVVTLDGRGLGRTLSEAYATPGCLLFIWGYGPEGHVGISCGDQTSVETPAAGHMVGIRDRRSVWTGAALVPGLDYSAAPPAPPPAPADWLETLAAEVAFLKGAIRTKPVRYGDNGAGVTVVQLLLKLKGYDIGTVDGAFGPKTLQAVQAFQHANGLVADGVVGPLTFGALSA